MSTLTPGRPREYEELSLSRAGRLYARAFAMRCPHCGAKGLLESWFRLRLKCGGCGLRTDRGEQDFFLGGMMWNIVFSEGALLIAAVVLGIATWPDVPWTLMQWGGIALMAITPFLLYPLSLVVWLASDILIRPVTAEEMEWHHASGPGEFRRYRDR